MRMTSAYTHGIGSNLPGSRRDCAATQPGGVVRFPLCGHAIAEEAGADRFPSQLKVLLEV